MPTVIGVFYTFYISMRHYFSYFAIPKTIPTKRKRIRFPRCFPERIRFLCDLVLQCAKSLFQRTAGLPLSPEIPFPLQKNRYSPVGWQMVQRRDCTITHTMRQRQRQKRGYVHTHDRTPIFHWRLRCRQRSQTHRPHDRQAHLQG